LQHRPPALVTAQTLAGADALSRVPMTAEYLWFATTVNSVVAGHPLGAGYAADRFAGWRPRERAERFVEPLWSMLCARTSADRAVLEPVLLWIDDQARSEQLPPEHAVELARYLQIWTALPRSAPTVSAVRILSSLIAHYPGTVLPALARGAQQLADLEVTSNLWAAVLGAVLRDPAPSQLTDEAAQWSQSLPLPRHLPTVDYAHDALTLLGPGVARPFAALVAAARPVAAPPLPTRFLLPDRRDANLFAGWSLEWIIDDNGHSAQVGSSAARLVLGLGGRRALLAARKGRPSSSASVRRSLDQAVGAWVAERVLDSRLATSRSWSRQAGAQPTARQDQVPLAPPLTRLYGHVDGSPDVRLGREHEVTDDAPWWVPSALCPTADSEVLSGAISPTAFRVVDREGKGWWVLDADARSMDHRGRDRPGILLDASRWVGSGDPAGIRLPPGSRYHWYLNLRHMVVACAAGALPDMEVDPIAEDAVPSNEKPGELLLGERLRAEPDEAPASRYRFAAAQEGIAGFLTPLSVDGVRTPAPALTNLLGARWTGDGCDFVAGGQMVLTRPDPRTQLLLISDDAVRGLQNRGFRLVGALETIDIRRRGLGDGPRAHWVVR
jgi:hypothetical protein